ncbi:MAG TPA: cache domain-containing protein [Anaeromyxobacteraceae bacterium]|nr:cache domain-containing protein [Anaeromyxobacteraceae bacterium]
MRNLSIRTKLVAAIVLTLGLSGVASALLVRALYVRSAEAASSAALKGAASAYEELERQEIEKLSTVLDVLVANPALRDAFAAKDRDRLQAVALPIHQVLKAEHRINHWNFIEPETRRMFLRPHLPTKFGDVIDRQSLLRAMSKQETAAGKELGKSEFALRVGRPFYADGKLIGYIELGEGIQHFLGRMKAQTGNDFAMFVAKRLLDEGEWARTRGQARNGWNDFPDAVVVNATTDEALVDEGAITVPSGSTQVLEETESGGRSWVRGVFPVRDASGGVVGGMVVRHDVTALRAGMGRALLVTLAVLALLALVASALVWVLVNRLIFRRLRGMMATMEDLSARVAGGDYDVASRVASGSADDEIGRFERFFAEFLALVGATLRTLSERTRRAAGRPPAVG